MSNKGKWVVFGVLILMATMVVSGCAKKVIARANGEAITQKEFYQQLEQSAGQMVLDRMITKLLVSQAAKEKAITVSPQEVESRIDWLKEQYGPQFMDMVKEQGMTEQDLQHELKYDIMLSKLVISDEDIEKYFKENKSRLDKPARFRYRRIVVASQKEAAEIRKLLVESGGDFATLAKQKSIDTWSKERGGDMGWREIGQTFDPDLEKMLPKLKAGDITQPLKVDVPPGYEVVKIEEKKPAQKATMENSRSQITGVLMEMKRAEIWNLRQDLKSKAKLEVLDPRYLPLAKQYEKLREQQPPSPPETGTAPPAPEEKKPAPEKAKEPTKSKENKERK